MQSTLPNKEIVVKPCNHTQLAAAYGVSRKVLRTWLRQYQLEIGPRKGYSYSITQLLIIFEKIGFPANQ